MEPNSKRIHRKTSIMAKELEFAAFQHRMQQPGEELIRITATFANYIPDITLLKACLVQVINEKEITLTDYGRNSDHLQNMDRDFAYLESLRGQVKHIDSEDTGQSLAKHVMRQPYLYQESLLRSIFDEIYYQGELNAKELLLPGGNNRGRVPKEELIQTMLQRIEPVLMFKNPFKPCPQKAKDEYSAYIRNMESMLQKLPDFLKEK